MFINSSQIHRNDSPDGEDCRYICILLHPSLLAGSRLIYEKTIAPIVRHKGIEYLQYDASDKGHDGIYRLSQDRDGLYEVNVPENILLLRA